MCDLSVSNLDGDTAHAILASAFADASVVTTVTVGAGEQHQPHRLLVCVPVAAAAGVSIAPAGLVQLATLAMRRSVLKKMTHTGSLACISCLRNALQLCMRRIRNHAGLGDAEGYRW